MMVNRFQEATRDAQQRVGRAALRTTRRLRQLEAQPQRNMASDDGGRKNIKGRARSAIANSYRAGKAVLRDQNGPWRNDADMRLRKAKPGYRAPVTRLY
jgi:hypothetical protein